MLFYILTLIWVGCQPAGYLCGSLFNQLSSERSSATHICTPTSWLKKVIQESECEILNIKMVLVYTSD